MYPPPEQWEEGRKLLRMQWLSGCGGQGHVPWAHGSRPGADPGFFAGGGGWQRRPCTAGAFGARADGGSRVDKHQIKVHNVHRIFRAIYSTRIYCKFMELSLSINSQRPDICE